jgi:actin-related protein
MFDEPNEPNLPHPECMLIVDSGFSYTHIVPLLGGAIVWDAVIRSVTAADVYRGEN